MDWGLLQERERERLAHVRTEMRAQRCNQTNERPCSHSIIDNPPHRTHTIALSLKLMYFILIRYMSKQNWHCHIDGWMIRWCRVAVSVVGACAGHQLVEVRHQAIRHLRTVAAPDLGVLVAAVPLDLRYSIHQEHRQRHRICESLIERTHEHTRLAQTLTREGER